MLPRMLPHSYCILFRLHFGFEVVLDALWMVQGKLGVGNKEDLCLSYIPVLLLTGVSMQLSGRAHLHTERRRKEE